VGLLRSSRRWRTLPGTSAPPRFSRDQTVRRTSWPAPHAVRVDVMNWTKGLSLQRRPLLLTKAQAPWSRSPTVRRTLAAMSRRPRAVPRLALACLGVRGEADLIAVGGERLDERSACWWRWQCGDRLGNQGNQRRQDRPGYFGFISQDGSRRRRTRRCRDRGRQRLDGREPANRGRNVRPREVPDNELLDLPLALARCRSRSFWWLSAARWQESSRTVARLSDPSPYQCSR
jgi:hypothetical protein